MGIFGMEIEKHRPFDEIKMERNRYVHEMLESIAIIMPNAIALVIWIAAFIVRGQFGWSEAYAYGIVAINIALIWAGVSSILVARWRWKELYEEDYKFWKLVEFKEEIIMREKKIAHEKKTM